MTWDWNITVSLLTSNFKSGTGESLSELQSVCNERSGFLHIQDTHTHTHTLCGSLDLSDSSCCPAMQQQLLIGAWLSFQIHISLESRGWQPNQRRSPWESCVCASPCVPDKYKRIQLSLKGPTCGSRDSPLRSFLQCRARFYLCSENKGGKKMRWLVSCDKQGVNLQLRGILAKHVLQSTLMTCSVSLPELGSASSWRVKMCVWGPVTEVWRWKGGAATGDSSKLKYFWWFRMTGVDIRHPEAPEIKQEQNSLDWKLIFTALEKVKKVHSAK